MPIPNIVQSPVQTARKRATPVVLPLLEPRAAIKPLFCRRGQHLGCGKGWHDLRTLKIDHVLGEIGLTIVDDAPEYPGIGPVGQQVLAHGRRDMPFIL